jgi:hypothetical protein
MKPRVAEIVKEMVRYRRDRYVSVQLGLLAELQSLLADEQAETAARILLGLGVVQLIVAFVPRPEFPAVPPRHDHFHTKHQIQNDEEDI